MLVDCVAGTDCATAGVQPRVKDSFIGVILLLVQCTHTPCVCIYNRFVDITYYVDTDSRNAWTQSNTYACETLQIPIAQAAPYGNVPTAVPMAAAGPPPSSYDQPVSARD